MLKSAVTSILLTSAASAAPMTVPEEEKRSRESFNDHWRFARFGPMPDGSTKAEPVGKAGASTNSANSEISSKGRPSATAFDDASWRNLNLPHDWGIEGPFRDDLPGRTGKLPWAGIGWYRKRFTIAEADRGKRIFIDVDGAMCDSTIWLNGKRVAGCPYGYSSYRVELTDEVNFGKNNVIAIRLDNKEDSSRWYPGGGIYRNVWLVTTDPVHVGHWGTYVTTPRVSKKQSTVTIDVTVDNQSEKSVDVTVSATLYHLGKSGLGNPVKVGESTQSKLSVDADGKDKTKLTASIKSPNLWSTKNPELYGAFVKVSHNGTVCDTYMTTFGIRTINYVADKGLLLNGGVVELKGVCQHHDLGPLGSAINGRALERQIEILQEMGCNSIRTSHNPPAPELLDLCDRMGMLVQVEAFDCWEKGKTRNDYARFFKKWHKRDLVAMVHRDRNHPSVIMWSTGNEVREQGNPAGHEVSQMLTDIIKAEDPTRPVTAGASYAQAGFNGFQKTIDVFGFNYKPHLYRKFRESSPTIPLYGSETSSCISSRGEYFFPVSDKKSKGQGGAFHMSSYDLYAPGWAYRPDVEFEGQDTVPETAGEYVWTGFDYIGEPTPYNKDITNLLNFTDPKLRKKMAAEMERLGSIPVPSRSSYFGIVDLCGFKKDRFYLYQARWRNELPMVHILPHWNWPERVGQITPIHVYTSGDEVELFRNGRSLGRKKLGKLQYRLRWNYEKYQPGTLRAVAYKNGKTWAETTVKTTGAASALHLSVDRKSIAGDGADLAFVTVKVTDSDGLMVPRTHNSVSVTIDGPGEVIAIGNGDPTSHESFQATTRKVFNGMALVIIRSIKGESGTIRLTTTSKGLKDASIKISTQ